MLTIPLSVLKADSEATVVIGIAKISLAIRANVGYLLAFVFYLLKILKSSIRGITFSSKYESNLFATATQSPLFT